MLEKILGVISPEKLKKYGIYAVLSFFISLSVLLGVDNLRVRDNDVKYERTKNESLQKMLNDQNILIYEQKKLLERTSIIDTTDCNNENN